MKRSVALVLVVVTAGCAQSSNSPAGPDAEAGVPDTEAGVPDTAAADSSATCLPGATPEDCARCCPSSCARACPKIDCRVFPTPVECVPLCGTSSCCECRRDFGDYLWLAPRTTIQCKTAAEAWCDALQAQWKAIVAASEITACTR